MPPQAQWHSLSQFTFCEQLLLPGKLQGADNCTHAYKGVCNLLQLINYIRPEALQTTSRRLQAH